MRITTKTPLFLLPQTATEKQLQANNTVGTWTEYGPVRPDAELFLLWLENKDVLYNHLQLTDAATMQQRLTAAEAGRATLKAQAPPVVLEDETVDDDPDTVVDDAADDGDELEPEPEQVNPREAEVDEGEDVSQFTPPPPPPPPPEARMPPPPPRPPRSTVTLTATMVSSTAPRAPPRPPPPPPESTVPLSEATEPLPPPPPPVATDDTADGGGPAEGERQTLLRQLDLLRLKFKQSVIPADIETQATPAVRLVVERNLLNLKRCRNLAMYKLGLAAFLVVLEFLLARLTRLDMSRPGNNCRPGNCSLEPLSRLA
jgi:hypothetical protein